jgi:hypothetical protein
MSKWCHWSTLGGECTHVGLELGFWRFSWKIVRRRRRGRVSYQWLSECLIWLILPSTLLCVMFWSFAIVPIKSDIVVLFHQHIWHRSAASPSPFSTSNRLQLTMTHTAIPATFQTSHPSKKYIENTHAMPRIDISDTDRAMLVVEMCFQPYLPQGKWSRKVNSRGTRIAEAHENHPELDFTDMNQPAACNRATYYRIISRAAQMTE